VFQAIEVTLHVMDEFDDVSTLTHEQKDELIRSLLVWVEKLTARAAELEARCKVLGSALPKGRFCF